MGSKREEGEADGGKMRVDGQRCYPFSYAFQDELEAQGIVADLPVPPAGEEELPAWERRRLEAAYDLAHAQDPPLAALCLSGGGIRSATFNLGMLQGLASIGLLDKFNYLSTVSGGGYIGSWLSSWTRDAAIAEVSTELENPFPDGNEIRQIRFLRDYSNYLSPRVGLLTLDTWTLFAIYLRNLLVNWLMLVPLLFAILVLPRLYIAYLEPLGDQAGFLWSGFAFGVLGNFCTAIDLPTIAAGPAWCRSFSRRAFVPFLLLSACSLSFYWASLDFCILPGWGAAASFAGFGACTYWSGWAAPSLLCLGKGAPSLGQAKSRRCRTALAFNAIAAASGAVGGMLAYLMGVKVFPALLAATWFPKPAYAALAVPAIMSVFLISGVVFIVGTNKFTGDDDREWWGRAGALVMLVILVWLLLFLSAVYGPMLVLHPFWETKVKLDGIATTLGLGGVTGLVTALFGKSKRTPAGLKGDEQKQSPFGNFSLQAGALLSIFLLVITLSSVATRFIESRMFPGQPTAMDMTDYPIPSKFAQSPKRATPFGLSAKEARHMSILWLPHRRSPLMTEEGGVSLLWLMLLAPLAFSLLVGWLVNPNRFSLHAMYRARLIRAYLGAVRDARQTRKPHPFTGFDPADNSRMSELSGKPMQIVNMAWNVVKGKRLGWQERKAMSFTASKLHCGSANVGYRPAGAYGGSGGITLGTAMAISGAAASPNMGYHSSPLITFVMAFFNVRLGWWMGNPNSGSWSKVGPIMGFGPMIRDAFGLTSSDSDYIYLSDGGHFENLGLYEMVRRRCRYLVVGDASCDPQGSLEDLGNAIRKIRVDLGIEIDLDLAGLQPRAEDKDGPVRTSASHFALGKIRYSLVDKGREDGKILYIKPSLCRELPGDVYHYAREFAEFPHQTTADQWFNESQFESYRKLGRHSIEHLTGTQREKGGKPGLGFDSFEQFFAFAARRVGRGKA